MQTKSILKSFIMATTIFSIMACNNSVKKNKNTGKSIDTEARVTQPPVQNIPVVEMMRTRKCFSNDGLKYSVTIKLIYLSATEVTGSVVSRETETNKIATARFLGMIDGNKVIVQFRGNPPIVGVASEWTSKPWTLENKSGKERINILFNAKNYETNKWIETNYEFEIVACD